MLKKHTAAATATLVAVLSSFSAYAGSGALKSVKVSVGDKSFAAPRWIFDSNPKVSEKTAGYDLYLIKKLQKEKKFEECAKQAKKSEMKNALIKPWILTTRLECGFAAYQKNKKSVSSMNEALYTANQNKEFMVSGPYVSRLREAWSESSLAQFEDQAKARKPQAWETFSRLEEVVSWFSRDKRARLYKQAGELAFLDQKLSLAVNFLEKASEDDESNALRQRLQTVRAEYYRSIKKEPPPEIEKPSVDETLEASTEELEIYNRMRDSVKTNDYVSAVEDGIRLIKEFPGGRRAQYASKQILSIYLSLAPKTDEKFSALKARVLEQMGKADGQRLYDWAQTLAQREFYNDAITLSQSSLAQIGGQPVSTKILLLLAQSALHIGDFKNAQKFLEKLIREHAGTKPAMEATFRLGLLLYRQEQYAESVSLFEKYLALHTDSDFEISSMYWLWRARQKLKNEKADDAAQELIRRYPLSYFAIRARYEINQNQLKFAGDYKENLNYEAEIWLTPNDSLGWERFQSLLKAGWILEAQAELEQLPQPANAEGQVVWAWLWGQTLNYHRTFEILQQIWQKDASFIRPAVLKIAYPQEFFKQIETEANKYKLPPFLVLSLMRQESSFRPYVQSPAGALGLMQVMPVTGREIATDLRIKLPNFPDDLYQPDINVRIGTNYIQRLVKNFDAHIPLVLAAYNAGIGNVRNWLSGRPDLAAIKSNPSSQIDAEIWFDELPWLETSGYIKSILRNWILYRYLDKGEVQFSDPLWRI
jgi:soluble lytic murein transglycosylase